MFGWFKKKAEIPEQGRDRSTLVPRIKNVQMTAALREMNFPIEQMPYSEPLVADLIITYAFDLPDVFQMASSESILELGIRLDEVREIAVANLKRQLPEIDFAHHGPIKRIVTGQNLEACILLATRFWNQVASQTDGEVVAAVPSRDVVLFCSSLSPEGITGLRELSASVLQEETTHGLTERLLTWRNSRWNEYDG